MYAYDFEFLYILLIDVICMFLLVDLFIKNNIFKGREETNFIRVVYYSVGLFILIDLFGVLLKKFTPITVTTSYIINGLRFLMLFTVAAVTVYNSTVMMKASKGVRTALSVILFALLTGIIALLAVNPYNGWFFTINDDGYHRGPYFLTIYAITATLYIISSVLCLVLAYKEKERHDKKLGVNLALISVPLLLCIFIQAFTGFSFLFFGYVMALAVGSIDMEENRYEIQRKQANNADVILGLTTDFDWVAYVTYTSRTSYWVSVDFRVGSLIRDNIPDWQEISSFSEKVSLIKNNVVMEADRESFRKAMTKEAILNGLKSDEAYFFNFRAEINNEIYYYQVKFVANFLKNRLTGFTVGIHSVNEEMKAEMKNKAFLEKMVTDRTKEISEKNEVLGRMNNDIIELMGNLVEGRDVESGEHVKRVKDFTNALANAVMENYPEYGLTPDAVRIITSASALHDVGKISIPDAILLKPGRLTDEEFKIMKTHCEKGCEILKSSPRDWDEEYLKTSYEICKYHHEKYDGRGYPEGLKGEEIPISAQIVAIADCYDALVSKRVYKDAYTCEEAYNMIKNGECGAFSDKILDCFAKCKDQFAEEVIKKRTENKVS